MLLPKQYADLANEGAPRLLVEALKLYGIQEKVGAGSNPTLLAWAKATGLDRYYKDDAIAWCGLFMGYVALQAGWQPPINLLGARNWLKFGVSVEDSPTPKYAALGDVLVFWRGSRSGWSGHVGIYVGEDSTSYHVLGGNQSDKVSIARVAKDRLLGARRCAWRINQPGNVRKIVRASTGAISKNEA
jgi:uncharacterized protein (TIGR02594 family)